MKEITVKELANMVKDNTDFQLIDVREPYEYDIANLKGELIPLAQVEESFNKINSEKQVVVHCRSGKRSADAIELLEKKYGFKNLYNLKGGILAWADEIDDSLPKY
ncbi:MAG: rhodanese-like domain-containing protein [Flammeovirgaceae bacterium]|nr:rhodanese-like domain-containing protein [Flammeovirgaceae bacterium]